MLKCTKTECLNRGNLVIDANVIRYVLGGTIDLISETKAKNTWLEKLPDVQTCLGDHLDLIKKCSQDGHLYVSEMVWFEELNINKLRDSAHPKTLSNSVYDNKEIEILHRFIQSYVNIKSDISLAEINEFRKLISANGCQLNDHDSSLMLVAYKLAQTGINSILVSDDPDFTKPWEMLANLANFSLQNNNYRTDMLLLYTYATFITRFHDCCSCPSDKYRALFNAWFYPLVNRQITKMGQGGKENVMKRIEEAMNAKDTSLQYKPKPA
jgi:hypothetical protein